MQSLKIISRIYPYHYAFLSASLFFLRNPAWLFAHTCVAAVTQSYPKQPLVCRLYPSSFTRIKINFYFCRAVL
jgi:hypothetical protein